MKRIVFILMMSIAFMFATKAEAAKIDSPIVGIWQEVDDDGQIDPIRFYKFTDSGEIIYYKFKTFQNKLTVSEISSRYEVDGNVVVLEHHSVNLQSGCSFVSKTFCHVHFEGNNTMIVISSDKKASVFKRAKSGDLERQLRSAK